MAAPSQEYLKTKVMTASPEMLTLMLWDGAIRFAEQGKDAILKKEIETSYKTLMRSQQIIMELSSGLKHSVNPDLCGKLAALYNFMYRRLVDANLKKDPALVDDALEIMRHQRETWVMLMDQITREKAAAAQGTLPENASPMPASEETSPAAAPLPAPTPAHRPSPTRRAYPSISTRPPAIAQASLSVQG